MALLKQGAIIQHGTQRSARYRVDGLLGVGGFGEAYAVMELTEDDQDLGYSCLKVTREKDDWHGEAYFMGLLRDVPHCVQVIDSFPALVGEGQAARMLFCIEMELLPGGTVADACEAGALPWPEGRVARQVRLLLGPLAFLHGTNTTHRDITPANVFLGNKSSLLLGDFGIAKTKKLKSGVRADAFNPAFVPRDLKTFWDTEDDVYQVGLLAMTLLAGEVQTNDVKKPAVNALTSRGPLREVIKKAISVKSQRYETAKEMADALKSG